MEVGGRRKGFCIFNKPAGEAARIQRNERGAPRIFPSLEEAEWEIASSVVTRIAKAFGQEVDSGNQATLNVRDYILQVLVLENGTVVDPEGNQFGPEERNLQ